MDRLYRRRRRRTSPCVRRTTSYDRTVSRQRRYFVLMGTCITLIVLAWFVVRYFSIVAAVAMSAVAMVLPPVAAIVGNRSDVERTKPKPIPPHRRHRW